MKYTIAIIGAGISGLSLGWFLKKRLGDSLTIIILEKQSRVGGWIRSTNNDGFLFEQGPRSCRTKGDGQVTLELVESLGMQEEVITPSNAVKKRYLYRKGKLQVLPYNLSSLLTSPFIKKFSCFLREWKAFPSILEDESIYSFITRRLGSGVAELFVDPLVSGIYAGDIHQLSVRSCFPYLFNLEKKYGSLSRGMVINFFEKKEKIDATSLFLQEMLKFPVFTLKKGMESLVKSLSKELSENIFLETSVKEIFSEPNRVRIVTDEGGTILANEVFLALPSAETANALKSFNKSLSSEIAAMPSTSVVVVNMGWKKQHLKHQGFGYLVPSKEKESILGTVWDSSVFPEQNYFKEETRLTVMLGGENNLEVASFSKEKISEIAREAVRRHLNINQNPDSIEVTIAKNAIPQYLVGHYKKFQNLENALKSNSFNRINLLGSAWHGVAVNNCIAESKRKANDLSSLLNPS